MIPSLFIGGAQKSGTTSLHFLLDNHPDLFFPKEPQEIHFFDIDRNYRKGLEFYEAYFRHWQGEPVIAQTSPLYLYEPQVPERIYQYNPQAKFIFILRNPVERAYSHYWHSVKYGHEIRNFEKAIALEKSRLSRSPSARRKYSYVDRGRYSEQIKRFLQFFPPEQILTLLFDDLKQDPQGVYRACGDFLEVDWQGFIPQSTEEVKNQHRIPRSRIFATIAGKYHERYLIDKENNKFPLVLKLHKKYNLKSVPYPPMNKSTEQQVKSLFKEEIYSLEQLLGVNLDCWK